MCDDRCGIDVQLEDGRIVDILGNREHLWNRGRLCVKARAAVDMVYHPDRILTPLKRTEEGWRRSRSSRRSTRSPRASPRIAEEHGARSIGVWKGEAIGFGQQENIARRFVHALGSPNYLSNDSMCYAARYFGFKLVDGAWPVPDLENADCIVLWGANPPYAHPNMTQYVTEARRHGATLVVVDPTTLGDRPSRGHPRRSPHRHRRRPGVGG